MAEEFDPLTPAECDCQGLPFMPLEVQRFMDSDLVALSTGEEFKAAVLLWAKAWGQVPAASLPDDDRILARMTGLPLADWLRVKDMAIKNWIKCSDGRLYHPVIADLAVEAWGKRRKQSARSKTRWSRVKASKHPAAMPRDTKSDATAFPRDAETDAAAMQGTDKNKGKSPPYSPPEGDDDQSDQIEEAYQGWNELASRLGLPVASGLDAARRRLIAKRLDEGGLDGWREALAGVERSAFLRGLRPGADGRTMRADLGFVAAAKNYPRLREGFYGDDAPKPEAKRVVPDWQGPAEVWRAVHFADPRCAVGFLAHTTWRDAPERAVVTDSRVIADRLRRDVSHVLKDLKVSIILERKEVA